MLWVLVNVFIGIITEAFMSSKRESRAAVEFQRRMFGGELYDTLQLCSLIVPICRVEAMLTEKYGGLDTADCSSPSGADPGEEKLDELRRAAVVGDEGGLLVHCDELFEDLCLRM